MLNKKIKVILTIHDLNFLYEDKPAFKKEKYLRKLQRLIDRSSAVICVSEFSKNMSEKIIRRGNEFSWDEKAREYIGVYNSLSGNKTKAK